MTTVKLYTKDVINACNAYSESLVKQIDEVYERKVQNLIKKPKRIFGFEFGGCTRSQAENRAKYSEDYQMLLQSYQHWHNRVKDLRRACESSSHNMIDLDIDDLKLIMPFLNYDEIQKR